MASHRAASRQQWQVSVIAALAMMLLVAAIVLPLKFMNPNFAGANQRSHATFVSAPKTPAPSKPEPSATQPVTGNVADNQKDSQQKTPPVKPATPVKPAGNVMVVKYDGRNFRSIPTTDGNAPLGEYKYGTKIYVTATIQGQDPYGDGNAKWDKVYTDDGQYVYVWAKDVAPESEAARPDSAQPDQANPAAAAAPAALVAPKKAAISSVSVCQRPNLGSITSGYGMRWGRMHEGLDFGGSMGSPILAAKSGTVINAELTDPKGFGAWVRIKHDDGTISTYGHVSTWLVHPGQHVSAGQEIATVGERGDAQGPHLHFEVRSGNNQVINPTTWLANCGVSV